MLQANYTNPQRDNFPEAVIRITSANRNKSSNQSARLLPDGSGHDYNENSSDTFNFTAEYWADKSRFDEGGQPYKFTGTANQENFNFQMTDDLELIYDRSIDAGTSKELSMEALAEQYMINNLLTGTVIPVEI